MIRYVYYAEYYNISLFCIYYAGQNYNTIKYNIIFIMQNIIEHSTVYTIKVKAPAHYVIIPHTLSLFLVA